jgi:hypothetical protein
MSAHQNLENINLEVVQRRVHRTIIEDGLLDIMIGVALVLSSLHLMNRSLVLNYLWIPIAVVLIEIIRRRFVYPRTGYVKLSFSAGKVASTINFSKGFT